MFWLSTTLFGMNVVYQSLLWVNNMANPPRIAGDPFELIDIPILTTVAWFGGLLAGVFGLLSLSIIDVYWVFNPKSRAKIGKATEWRYGLLPIIYGIVWIVHLGIVLLIEPQM